MSFVSTNKEKLEPDVVDNQEFKMADTLNRNLGRINFLDISSGYFEVSGYAVTRESLELAVSNPSFKFRLLLGRDAIRPPTYATFEEYREHTSPEMIKTSLGVDHLDDNVPTIKSSLDKIDFDNDAINDVYGLIKLLKHDNVQLHLGRSRFNHAKCYILGDVGAIVGSSNFTRSGLSINDELNVGVYSTATWKKIREWYERMWATSDNAKKEMLKVLEQSKFGVPATPHEIYMKILFEIYKKDLADIEKGNRASTIELAEFQRDAVSIIQRTINKHGGAILADSTGLGKTHIGLEVMRRKMLEKKKVLLIAPAQVRDTVWRDKLEEVQINARMIGIEELGKKDFNVFKYKKYNFIIIDESQNFRTRTTGRRDNLMKLMSLGKKEVLLMTATPVNNSLMDLYYQISIITRERDDRFVDIGIPNLYEYMRKAANHKIDDGLEKIQLLLDAIMVRRTRTFIKDVYPNGTLNGKPITFPHRDYKPIRYGMTDLFGDIYQDLVDTISSLHMVPYGIERYNKKLTDEEKRKHTVLAHLQVILLLKRFESSVSAVTISIKNKIRLFEYFEKLLMKGHIIPPKDLNRLMERWTITETEEEGIESNNEGFIEDIKKLATQDAQQYDTTQMKKDIKSDLEHLKRYKESLGDLPEFDQKAESVAKMILGDRALETESQKVLVFTEYTDTAKYIKKYLEKKFRGKQVALITGSTKSARSDIIKRFSPISNSGEDEEKPKDEIQILVSTEILSEGQNLQDCNYIINYDLPWNPMRLVQRIGRIDRLNSTYDVVHSRECFPDKKLDVLLKLVDKLGMKINDVNESVGLDTNLLGQEASPKNFQGTTIDHLKILSGDGDSSKFTNALERKSDLAPMRSSLSVINQYIRNTGMTQMEEFPMGRRTGKAGKEKKVVLFYLDKESDRVYSVVYNYATTRAEVVDNTKAINIVECIESEEVYLPMDSENGKESFKHLLKLDKVARDAIRIRNDEDHQLAAELYSKQKKVDKIIVKIRDVLIDEAVKCNISPQEIEKANSILNYDRLQPWSSNLEKIFDEYKSSVDVKGMIRQLKQLWKDIGSNNEIKNIHVKKDVTKFVLVGTVFIHPREITKNVSFDG